MAFTFQINSDVEFNRDEKLLKKAESFKPQLKFKDVSAKNVVELIKDESKLTGVGVKPVYSVEELTDRAFKRDDQIILDFGQHNVGKFSIDLKHVGSPMDAPLTLKLKFAELPAELAADTADYNGWLSKSWIQEELLQFDTLPVHLELPRRYSFRYVEISVVDTSPKWQVAFENPVVRAQSSVEYDPSLLKDTGDDELNQINEVGLKTLAECMQEVFEDGPKRDRRLWIGDLRLQALANYASFDETNIVKYCLYLFGAMSAKDGRISANVFTGDKLVPDDTFMLDYGMFFVSIMHDYLEKHSDPEMLSDLFPIAQKQVDYVLGLVDKNGALPFDEDYPVFVDWSNDFDKTTSGQAILIYVLKQFIDLAKLAGKDTAKYEQALKLVTDYALNELYDSEKQFFVSGPKREVNVSSQVWMVLAGVYDDNAGLMKRTVAELFPVKGIATPYMYHHITEALFVAGLKDEAIKLIKSYWGKMVDLGADTFWEAFNPDQPEYSPYGSPIVNSYCHAWSCTPVYLFEKYL